MPEERDEQPEDERARGGAAGRARARRTAAARTRRGEPGEADAPRPRRRPAGEAEEPARRAPRAARRRSPRRPRSRAPRSPPAEEPPRPRSAGGRGARCRGGARAEEAGRRAPPRSARARARRQRARRREPEEEVIPGAHLEPDLVLEEQRARGERVGEYAEYAEDEPSEAASRRGGGEARRRARSPCAHTPLDLAADARYQATGKRKSAVARVILKPGEGTYSDQRPPPRRVLPARHASSAWPASRSRPPATRRAWTWSRRIHGGGVSAQAAALRHGIARALVEADPACAASSSAAATSRATRA